jgi:hypothetical protein
MTHAFREASPKPLNGYLRSKTFNGTTLFEFYRAHLAIGDEARIPDRLLGAQRRASVD